MFIDCISKYKLILYIVMKTNEIIITEKQRTNMAPYMEYKLTVHNGKYIFTG